ncbi:hypothetical protein HanIR_Chr02g0064271 [Helianthus annuus]|nr:hypothetical protein HanIR_Chr02g0064271 [Helianthus annuus]
MDPFDVNQVIGLRTVWLGLVNLHDLKWTNCNAHKFKIIILEIKRIIVIYKLTTRKP